MCSLLSEHWTYWSLEGPRARLEKANTSVDLNRCCEVSKNTYSAAPYQPKMAEASTRMLI